MATLEATLKDETTAEIHFDPIHKRAYSVDASIFEVEPLGVAIPKNKQDLFNIVRIAKNFRVPIIPRGAATGITGGCIGEGLIIDTSKYLTRILEINYKDQFAICEPGVIQDQLNAALAEKGYRLGPDTSTGNRATLGGMLANNAAGARSLRFGKMSDHVLSVETILSTGDILYFHELDEQAILEKRHLQTIEGKIYREFDRIKEIYGPEIEKKFPKIPRRVSGYNLDELIKPGPFNPARLIAGSEGTLGFVSEITMAICKKPKHVGICIIHFKDMLEGMNAIMDMLAFEPLALEMIDDKIIEMGRISPSMKGKLGWLQNTPKMVFIAEFDGETKNEVEQKLSIFKSAMAQKKTGYAQVCLIDPVAIASVWEIRKSGLGLLLSKRTYSRAIAFVEDLTVPPHQLASFIHKFNQYMHAIGKEAGIYGHVGSGCMHVRPYIDLRQYEELSLMKKIMEDIADMVLEHGGALSGEHGDGMLRAWLNKKMFGEKVYQAFIDLKQAFDPDDRMNPGKIINGPQVFENLRVDPLTMIKKIDTFMNWDKEGGFALAVDLCNGNALCRKKEGVMCPSFQASGDEYDTTRARAQALRAIITNRIPEKAFGSDEVLDVLDLCLECKGCKTECPSQVDMAKMKSEFLYQYYKKHIIPLRTYFFGYIGKLSRLAFPFARWFNQTMNWKFAKYILGKIGITTKRPFPNLAKESFSSWFKNYSQPQGLEKEVVLYNDTYNEFYHPHIGISAVKVLNQLGYKVIVPSWECCGRPMISKGLLPAAKKQAKKNLSNLLQYAEKNMPIIGLEPSCILTFVDEFIDLLNDKETEIIKRQVLTFDEFITQHIEDGKLPLNFNTKSMQVLLHGHCHQKALVGTKFTINVLKAIPGFEVKEIPSGCCGVAGSFGYESEHYAFSMKIGELVLLPAIRSATSECIIVANGTSCRSQIQHGANRIAKHLAEVLFESLA